MFIRRFLQTSISFQKPLKSKLDRYRMVLNEIGPLYKEMKAEKLTTIKNGKIPSIEILKEKFEKCSNWQEIFDLAPILKEIRFLGSPKRTKISLILISKLEEIYEKFPEEEHLIKFLAEILKFDQLNPLIIAKEGETSDTYKKIIYTAKDIINRK